MELFGQFKKELEKKGVITHEGSIIDASFIDVPRQRNNREENKTIKNGGIPEDWQKAENSAKLSQKDTDARWAKKGGEVHFGYKDHVKVDKDSKLIVDYDATSTEVHDSQCYHGLIGEQDKDSFVVLYFQIMTFCLTFLEMPFNLFSPINSITAAYSAVLSFRDSTFHYGAFFSIFHHCLHYTTFPLPCLVLG